jgi:hypothetical protein
MFSQSRMNAPQATAAAPWLCEQKHARTVHITLTLYRSLAQVSVGTIRKRTRVTARECAPLSIVTARECAKRCNSGYGMCQMMGLQKCLYVSTLAGTTVSPRCRHGELVVVEQKDSIATLSVTLCFPVLSFTSLFSIRRAGSRTNVTGIAQHSRTQQNCPLAGKQLARSLIRVLVTG